MGRALGELEQLLLFAVVELGEGAYGAAIGRAIEARTGKAVSSGAVYTGLDRLEQRGFLESHIGEPTSERGGRRRKHVTLTPEGAAELRRSVEVFRAMSEGLLPQIEAIAEAGGS